jgi:hypothetical protein
LRFACAFCRVCWASRRLLCVLIRNSDDLLWEATFSLVAHKIFRCACEGGTLSGHFSVKRH